MIRVHRMLEMEKGGIHNKQYRILDLMSDVQYQPILVLGRPDQIADVTLPPSEF